MEQPHSAGSVGQPLLGKLEIPRINIQPDQQPLQTEARRGGDGVPPTTYRAIYKCLSIIGLKRFEHLVEQNRIMTAGGNVHDWLKRGTDRDVNA